MMDTISERNKQKTWLRLTIAAALFATATFAYTSLRAARAEAVTRKSGDPVKPVNAVGPSYGIDPGIFRAIPGSENIDPQIFRKLDRAPDIDKGIFRDLKVQPTPSHLKTAKTAKTVKIEVKDLARPRSD